VAFAAAVTAATAAAAAAPAVAYDGGRLWRSRRWSIVEPGRLLLVAQLSGDVWSSDTAELHDEAASSVLAAPAPLSASVENRDDSSMYFDIKLPL